MHEPMLALSVYSWWKFLHLAGVIAFVLFHGVSVVAALVVRKERDRQRIAVMLQISGSSVIGMYVSLAWLVVFGFVAGIQASFWNDGWFLISIGLLALVTIEMVAVAKPYYRRVKEAVEVRPSGVPRRSDEELEEILRSPVAVWNVVVGLGALAVITWLMVFKPFLVV